MLVHDNVNYNFLLITIIYFYKLTWCMTVTRKYQEFRDAACKRSIAVGTVHETPKVINNKQLTKSQSTTGYVTML